jgi:hypothetical protein
VEPQPDGKFLYDIVSARLAAQAADQLALTGRAKDLIGFASITTTITGVVANDKIVTVNKSGIDALILGLLAVGLAMVITFGIQAIRPRAWFLSPDPHLVADLVHENYSSWTVDDYYAAVANGFTKLGVGSPGNSALGYNEEQLKTLRRSVLVQIIGVSALAACGVLLALEAVVIT